jgi:transposase
MLIIGCDFHSRFQQIAMVDTETGELIECRLEHRNTEAEEFYASLQKPVRVGMEATGYAQWFERMLAKLGHELWVGDGAQAKNRCARCAAYSQSSAREPVCPNLDSHSRGT